MNNNNYLNNIGAFEVTVNKVIVKEASQKSKAATYLEFKDDLDRIVSLRFNRPFLDFDYTKAARIISQFGTKLSKDQLKNIGEARALKGLETTVGKKCIALVTCEEYNGRNFFKVSELIDSKYAIYIQGGPNVPICNDPIGAALDTFQGAQIKPDETTLGF